jgi:hypothetical protein
VYSQFNKVSGLPCHVKYSVGVDGYFFFMIQMLFRGMVEEKKGERGASGVENFKTKPHKGGEKKKDFFAVHLGARKFSLD